MSFDIGRALGQATVRKREWKRPLWRVRRARLTISVDGRTQRIDIAEMMAWQGAWYVTRLH